MEKGNSVRIGLAESEPAGILARRTQWRRRRKGPRHDDAARLRGYVSAFAVNIWGAGAIMGEGNIKRVSQAPNELKTF